MIVTSSHNTKDHVLATATSKNQDHESKTNESGPSKDWMVSHLLKKTGPLKKLCDIPIQASTEFHWYECWQYKQNTKGTVISWF